MAAILEFTSSLTSAVLTIAEALNGKDEQKEKLISKQMTARPVQAGGNAGFKICHGCEIAKKNLEMVQAGIK